MADLTPERRREIAARVAALRTTRAAHEADPDNADKRWNANIAVIAMWEMAIDDIVLLLADRAELEAALEDARARLEAARATFAARAAHYEAGTGTDLEGLRNADLATEATVAAETLARMADPGVQITHHADCWRYHHACAVTRLEAVAEVRKQLDAEAVVAGGVNGPNSDGARVLRHAADLLGKALEG